MAKNDPYKDSPYDASGMPLGAETADYDNFADVAQKMVGDKVPTYPENINQIDYVEAVIETEPEHSAEGFNSAIAENENSAYTLDVKTEDMADTGTDRVLYSHVNTEDGTTETIDTPKMGNSASIEQGKEDIHASDNDFLATLEATPVAPAPEAPAPVQDAPASDPAPVEADSVNKDKTDAPTDAPAPQDAPKPTDPQFYVGTPDA